MSNHKPTIGSLTKEIMGLLWILIKICVSYIEDFTREILNLAISHDTNNHLSEEDESRERAVHFADGFHDGDWQRDMEQDTIDGLWNGGSTGSVNDKDIIYDGIMGEDKIDG